MKEDQPSKPSHTYMMDPESPTEMARLMLADRMTTEGMHGLFPERASLENIETVLDVGCGPGGWALDVAHTYPEKTVVGIDISTTMVTYAQARASAQRLNNVTCAVMSALEPLKFAAGTFDLVNIRFAIGFVPRVQWPTFLEHCLQVLRPGGVLRLTEAETNGLSNSPAYEKMLFWMTQRLHKKGYGFSPDGSHLGILPMLGRLLQEVGCVNIEFKPHMLDFSTGTALYDGLYQNYMVMGALLEAPFIQEGIATKEEFDQIYRQMLEDMQQSRFRGLNSLLTVWGEKPSE